MTGEQRRCCACRRNPMKRRYELDLATRSIVGAVTCGAAYESGPWSGHRTPRGGPPQQVGYLPRALPGPLAAESPLTLIEAEPRYVQTIEQASGPAAWRRRPKAWRRCRDLVRKLEDVPVCRYDDRASVPLVAASKAAPPLRKTMYGSFFEALPPLVEVSRYGNVRGTDRKAGRGDIGRA